MFPGALLGTVNVTNGYALSAASGELVPHDGGFAYRATFVPEPQTWALMALGLGAVAFATRGRRHPMNGSPRRGSSG